MKVLIALLIAFNASFASAAEPEASEVARNIASTKIAYESFGAGDLDAWRAVHSDKVVWTILEGLPYAGTHVGPQAIIDNVFMAIATLWPDFKIEPIAYYGSGDKVFVHVAMTIDGSRTEAVHMATLKDGKQVAFTPFENSAFMMNRVQSP